ncbi:DHH family phosphoesterase [Calditerrivibrio sp.]|jgi:oligoribonuclease NrnB/cAMP/cGMP phosphodiesterase (DHH superfamily)|uniref:DHH family phosphoesterase n=1 Tax=Calditerrivibrio sp. TaxID=2792612 RepID=UPI003D0DCF9C
MILHVTHNDLDGVGCAILVKRCYDFVDTYYLNYDDVDSFIQNNYANYEQLIISDISPSEETFKYIENHIEIVFIDHHKTSLHLGEYALSYLDTTVSATYLTMKWLEESGFDLSEYHDFVDCVNDFDMWHLKRDDSLKMNMLFTILGLDRFRERFLNNPSTKFTEVELLLLDLESESLDKYLKNAEKMVKTFVDKNNRKFGAIFAEKYNSELGNHLIKTHDFDYVFIINAQRGKVSMRSKPDFDVSEIAVKNGGGGHKNAAGFSTNYDFGLNQFLKNLEVY